MTTIVTRAAKGSRLTWGEVDANFTNLNADKVETINPTSSGTLTHSGDIVLSGSGKRITGDFSNATIANRAMFQSSTVNGQTGIIAVPNGTSTNSSFEVSNAADPTNASVGQIAAFGSTEVRVTSGIRGTGSYLPMTFYTGGAERMRIATDGSATFNGLTNFVSDINLSTGTDQYFYFDGALHISKNGAGERLQIDANGNVLVTNATGGLGYGIGSGGTVTQATSKATAVTINKPTGLIITSAAALAANTAAVFIMNNSLVAASDCVVVSLKAGDVDGGSYVVGVNAVFPGQAYIYIRNMSAGSRSEALQINFAIIKGATT